jgi:hypothetical protein
VPSAPPELEQSGIGLSEVFVPAVKQTPELPVGNDQASGLASEPFAKGSVIKDVPAPEASANVDDTTVVTLARSTTGNAKRTAFTTADNDNKTSSTGYDR